MRSLAITIRSAGRPSDRWHGDYLPGLSAKNAGFEAHGPARSDTSGAIFRRQGKS